MILSHLLGNAYESLLRDRSELLSEQTEYHNLALELFLPSVKQGVITGLSAVIWHCLCYGTRVYNCDPRPMSKNTIDNWSLFQHFPLPWCENKLEFNSKDWNPLADEIMNASLKIELEKDLCEKS